MMEKVSAMTGKALAKQANYSEEKEQILVYMLNRIFTNVLFLFLLLIFTHLLDVKLTAFIFVTTFLPIRRTFGGWHVSNSYLCLVISIVFPLIVGYLATLIKFNLISIIGIYIIAFIIAMKKGVVDNKNKRLKDFRKAKFKRQGLISLLIIGIIHMIVFIKGICLISNAMTLGIIIGFTNLLFKEI